VRPDISDALDDLIHSALRFDREKRLKTAQLFARALAGSAKSMGLLADADEVADVVNRLAGPELTQRKQRLAEARKARRISAPDVRELAADSGRVTPIHMRPALPSLPEIPITPLSAAVPVAPGSELGIQVDLDRADTGDRASDRLLGGESSSSVSPTPDPPESAPEVYRSPVGLPDESPARRTAGVLEAKARQAQTIIAPFFKPPWTRKKIITLASAGGGVLLFLIIVIALASGGDDAQKTTVATRGSSSASALGSGAPDRAPTTVPGAGGGLALSPELPEDTAPTLHITANGSIARAVIGGRSVEAVVPAPMLGVELSDEEESKTLQIVVTSTDGRVAVANAEPGTRDVEVTFGGGAAPAKAKERSPTPTPTTKPKPRGR
jgi:hypothetical protein